jgi:hypothetical protein
VVVVIWCDCPWKLAEIAGVRRDGRKRATFVAEFDGGHDLGQTDSIVLRVRETDHDTVLVTFLLLDNVELHILLTLSGAIFTVALLQRGSEFVEATVGLIDEDTGANLAEDDLEELVVEANKNGTQNIECVDDLETALAEAAEIQRSIAFQEEIIQHPSRLE